MEPELPDLPAAEAAWRANPSAETAGAFLQALMGYENEGEISTEDLRDGVAEVIAWLS